MRSEKLSVWSEKPMTFEIIFSNDWDFQPRVSWAYDLSSTGMAIAPFFMAARSLSV